MATSENTIDLVESFYVALEELRSAIGANNNRSKALLDGEQLQFRIPALEKLTKSLFEATLDLLLDESYSSENGARQLIAFDCYQKASQAVTECVRWICTGSPIPASAGNTSSSSVTYELPDGGPITQAAIAHILECALGIITSQDTISSSSSCSSNTTKVISEIQQLYSTYQKNLLRQRCKPSVANIVNLRSVAQSQSLTVHQLLMRYSSQVASLTEIDDDGDDGDQQQQQQKKQQQQAKLQPHMFALTTILTEATHLLHPLGCWYNAIPPLHRTILEEALSQMCHDAIRILDLEVQTLCSRIGAWFIQDREVSVKWMKQVASTISSSSQQQQQQQTLLDAKFLDTILLEELSYVCQLISRYCEFIAQCCSFDDKPSESAPHPLSLLAQEYIGFYSTLEDFLYTNNLQRAIDIAKPVEINDGIFVSSLVEDAFYLSKKTLERARSTKNDQALLTITNRICESWRDIIFDAIATGVGSRSSTQLPYQTSTQDSTDTNVSATPSNKKAGEVMNSFTAAFLDALDEDMGPPKPPLTADKNSKFTHQSPPPSFGGITSDDVSTSVDWRLKTCICSLNSIASASSACLDISFCYEEIIYEFCQVEFNDDNNNSKSGTTSLSLDSLDQNPVTKLLDVTREEWLAHSKQYSTLLQSKISDAVDHWCGAPLDWSSSDILMDGVISGNSLITKMLSIDKALSPLQRIQKAFAKQSYNIADADTYYKVEADAVLISQLVDPLRTCQFLSQIMLKRCDQTVTVEVASLLTTTIAQEVILPMIFLGVGPLKTRKLFTDWGALLFAKQVRLLQSELCSLLNCGYEDNLESTGVAIPNSNQMHHALLSTKPILALMEQVNQVVTILQLEKPSDWISLKYAAAGGNKDAQLTKEEIRQVMMLRVGFSKEAIAALYDAL